MEQTRKSSEERPVVRLLAGIFAALALFVGLPASVYCAIPDHWNIWLVAFSNLFAFVAFATVAVTGRLFCFRKPSSPKDA
jgi:membrane protein YdbS with pleckstrin-like domain